MGIAASIDISAEQRGLVLDLIHQHLPNTAIWAFGSRVKWTTRSNSDLDLVAFATSQQDPQVSALKEAFEESNLPFRVDLLVWDKLPESFKQNIQECYVVLVEGNDLERGLGRSFELTTLGEYAKVQGGYAYKSEDFSDSGKYPVLKIKNVRFGNVDYSEASFISEKTANETIDWKTKEGDILISMTGSGPNAPQSLVGRVARVWADEPKAWINQRVGRLVLKEEGVIHPDFLFYLLGSSRSQDFLVSNSSGSANQANISGKTIESLPCPKVDYEQSAEIAKILRELDQKILINRQTNQTLEQIAQALFKSWFVDFEPVKAKIAALNSLSLRERAGVRGQELAERAALCAISGKTPEQLAQLDPQTLQQLKTTAALFPDALSDSELGEIPEGWRVGKMEDCCIRVESGGTPKRSEECYWGGDIKWLTSGEVRDVIVLDTKEKITEEGLNSSSAKLWPQGSTVVAMYGATAGQICLLANEMTANQACCALIPKVNHQSYLFLSARRSIEGLAGKASGSAQQNLNKSLVAGYQLLIPSENLVSNFDTAIMPLLERWINNTKENVVISEIRDSLLPKLLSGEINLRNL